MIYEGFREMVRLAAAEGAVLLKNEKNTLPIRGERAAVFGRCQIDYFKSGTGSGGAVNTRHTVTPLEGLRKNGYIEVDEEIASLYEELAKKFPADRSNRFFADFSDEELDIPEDIISAAAKRNDKAVIIIGRTAGEAYDSRDAEGGFLLTGKERALIERVGRHFERYAVLLNTGGVMDMRWVSEYDVPAVMYIWQGGEEGGDACADLVSGIAAPSGRLADTIAKACADYPSTAGFFENDSLIYAEDIYVGYRYFETFAPERTAYPFGFGLGYTEFEQSLSAVRERNGVIELSMEVRNTGKYTGREVVQVYTEAPAGMLGHPKRELAAFVKTRDINPGGTERVTLKIPIAETASYDDTGVTGHKNAWVLEKGTYNVYAGKNVRDAKPVYSYRINKTELIGQCEERMAPIQGFSRLVNDSGSIAYEKITPSARSGVFSAPEEIPDSGYDKDFAAAVKEGHIKQFSGHLTNEELAALSRGEGMMSPRVTPGTASCFGGVSEELIKKGIPSVCTSDGPSGIRADSGAQTTSMPSGTLLACTWDTELVQGLYEYEARELLLNSIDMLLGPAMNIHRNPLCGRNFEYFSEDPLLSGTMAAAAVRGMHSGGAEAVLKHFACNNREQNRHSMDTVVSERALREIYLRGFEIAVKTSPVCAVMTSYNKINGYHSASNYDLTAAILRDEWGFDGVVMTDWWANMNGAPDTAESTRRLGAMAHARNDLYMVVGNFEAGKWDDDIAESLENGSLTRGELQQNACCILDVISRLHCFERRYGFRKRESKKYKKQFGTEKAQRGTYKFLKCDIPDNAPAPVNTVLTDMIAAERSVCRSYDGAAAYGGDEIRLALITDRDTKTRISFVLCAEGNALSRFGMTIQCGGAYAVSYSADGNADIETEPVTVPLSSGMNTVKIRFDASNPARTVIKKLMLDTE